MRDSFDFTGQTVLVVGGSSGIGNGIARAFRRQGAEVHVTGTRPLKEDYAASEWGDLAGLEYHEVDFGRPQALDNAKLSFSSLNALVLCQGTTRAHRAEFDSAVFRSIMEINLNSMMDCAMKFKAALSAAKGSVILVSSVAAYKTLRGQPAYNASKAAILGLTRALAASFIGDKIRVNGIAPGLIETKLAKGIVDNPENLTKVLRNIPIGRAGSPADIAGAALYLASPFSAYVVGHTLVVDGGMMLS
jgi:3-oxoacyl-[acyl-carrier protein] reductase